MSLEQQENKTIGFEVRNLRIDLLEEYPAVHKLFSNPECWYTDPYTDERFTPIENILPLLKMKGFEDKDDQGAVPHLFSEVLADWEEETKTRLGTIIIGFSDEVFCSAFEIELLLRLIEKNSEKLAITNKRYFSGTSIKKVEARVQEKIELEFQLAGEVVDEDSDLEADFGISDDWFTRGKIMEVKTPRGETTDAVGLYLKEMARVPLLNSQEEIDLSKRVERGTMAEKELNKLSGRGLKEKGPELELIISDAEAASAHLVNANTRLVVSIAKRYIGRGVPFLDLIQEGNLGLMKAVKKYDYRRGFRFSTYATWWIRQTITRGIADTGRTIRVPVHMIDRLRYMYKAIRRLEQELGRPPKVEEIAKKLDIKEKMVQWMLQVSWLPLSLESPVGDDEDSELGMFIEDEDAPQPAEVTYHGLLSEKIEEVLNTLSARERRILRLRFGLENGRSYTLEEVGEKFGLTRERIRQIEGKALRRLRHPMRSRQLREYL